ncbi:MFS transporter [Dickeya zeae]|uniref:MFS transporter n=1 Tax=Dickeya zeae TaxID=204042 RepID=UPI0003AB2591|nr:MFS transporter [Dickeya zeae]
MSTSRRAHQLAILVVMTSASLVGLVQGYSIPLVTLKLTALGYGSALTGMMSALPAIGVFVSSWVAAPVAMRLPVGRLLALSTWGMGISLTLSFYLDNVALLAVPRFMMGFCCGLIIVIGESWVSGHTAEHRRGVLVGLYATAFTGLQLLGPLLISFTGLNDPTGLLLILALHGLCLLMVPGASFSRLALSAHRQHNLFSLLLAAPALAMAVFAFAFFDGAVLSMLPLYGMAHGYEESLAVLLVTVLFIGDALLQVPLGWISDKLGTVRVHLACGVMFVLMLAGLPFSYGTGWVWANVFVLGAVAGSIYTLSLVRAGKSFSGVDLVAINALFGVLWGVGSFSGPLVSGSLMQWYGRDGLIAILVLLGLLFLAANALPTMTARYADRAVNQEVAE